MDPEVPIDQVPDEKPAPPMTRARAYHLAACAIALSDLPQEAKDIALDLLIDRERAAIRSAKLKADRHRRRYVRLARSRLYSTLEALDAARSLP